MKMLRRIIGISSVRSQASSSQSPTETITYVGSDLVAFTNTTTVTVEYPSVQANDIILVIFSTTTNINSDGTPPSGFTKLTEFASEDTNDVDAHVFWKRASGSETSDNWTTIFDNNTDGIAVAVAYRGCVESGSPIDTSNITSSASGTGKTVGPVTTNGSNRMVVGIMCSDPDSNPATTCSWDSPATERLDQDTTPSGSFGELGAVYLADYIQSTAASISFNATLSSAEEVVELMYALIPEPL